MQNHNNNNNSIPKNLNILPVGNNNLSPEDNKLGLYNDAKAKFAREAAKKTLDFFVSNKGDFKFNVNFSMSEIVTNDGKRFLFLEKTKNLKLLGLSKSIKTQVKKSIKNINLLPIIMKYIKVKNNFNYNTEQYIEKAFEYDLNNAYSSLLYFLFLKKETYEKMVYYKKELGFNINECIGMALLGRTTTTIYDTGLQEAVINKENELIPVFYLLRYLTIKTIQKLLDKNEFINNRIAFFVDAIILKKQIDISYLSKTFFEILLETINELNILIKEKEKIDLNDIFIFKNNLNENCFTFKEVEVSNLKNIYNKITRKNNVLFIRDNKLITYR